MIRLLFVGDGERDAATNPHLVTTLIGADVDAATDHWRRLHVSGYDRKLRFAIRRARDQGLDGVVATIDRDKSPGKERLGELVAARTKDRETASPLPTAVGCAIPHAEAWLLDDPVAVRSVLRLDTSVIIPNVGKVANPKDELTSLHSTSLRSEEPMRTILIEIAQALDPSRCQHTGETGFKHFVKDVHDEIAPLANAF